jgi:hypothetical protein
MAYAQATPDTLPERVVEQVYDAINRCDRAAYYSWFAPVWHHSKMEDSTAATTRHTDQEASRDPHPATWWSTCGDPRWREPDGLVRVTRQIVLGPYVVIEEAVRNGRSRMGVR